MIWMLASAESQPMPTRPVTMAEFSAYPSGRSHLRPGPQKARFDVFDTPVAGPQIKPAKPPPGAFASPPPNRAGTEPLGQKCRNRSGRDRRDQTSSQDFIVYRLVITDPAKVAVPVAISC